jgi:molybdate transport system substrate-binding protein
VSRPSGPALRRLTTLFAGIVLLCACGGAEAGNADGEPLLVMAAASLSEAMPALIERFEVDTGIEVDLTLSSTGSLAAQIVNGAPGDLFFSADVSTVERLAAEGLIRRASVSTFAVGDLALVWRPELPRPRTLAALSDPAYRVLAIANPETAPYGAGAKEALQRVGIWEAVQLRIVQGENVAQAYQLVQTGNADAAIVARSVVDTAATPTLPVGAALHAPVRQAAGILSRSVHPAAERFLGFVLGTEGQAILARYGFTPASAPSPSPPS